MPPPVRIPGTSAQRPRAVGEQLGAVAEQRGRAAAADLAQSVGEDPRDRSERVLVAAHRPGRVDDQPDVRLLDRSTHLPGDPPRVRAHRSAGCLLGAAACVRAAVEAPARGALVDLPRPPRDRLAQPVGVAAGVLHLVGERGPVDAAVGQPAARQPGPAPAAELASPPRHGRRRRAEPVSRSTSSSSCSSCAARALAIACSIASASDPRPAHVGAALAPAGVPIVGGSVSSSTFTGCPVVIAGIRWRVGRSDDLAVLAGCLVEAVELAVGDPHDPGVQLVERAEVVIAEHRPPQLAEAGQVGRVDDPVVGAGLQVDGRARGEIACQRLAAGRELEHLLGEGGEDHVRDRRLQRPADEPAAQRVGRELAHAVGLHPRLLEQPPVDRELPVGGIVGLGQREVVLDRPALGVLGVERLVQRDPEAAQDRPPLERAGGDRGARAEQRLGVEVDGARVDLDVPGIGQAGPDQRPHRVQALQHDRPVVGEVLVDAGRAGRAARPRGAAAARTPPAEPASRRRGS